MSKKLLKPKILIVDDDSFNIKLLGEILRSDYEVCFATNGLEGIKIATANAPPDLILMDIMMPEMDGYEVCKVLREDQQSKDIPVIFVTANTDDETLKEAFESGGTDYVRKPVSRIELLARIKSALTEQMLKKKLVEKEKFKGVLEMAGAICHELNQPMQVISGYSELLIMNIPEENTIYRYIENIKDQIGRMGEITRKLMRITRYETRSYMGNRNRIIDIDKSAMAPD